MLIDDLKTIDKPTKATSFGLTGIKMLHNTTSSSQMSEYTEYASSANYTPTFDDSTIYDSSSTSTSVMATMANDTAPLSSLKRYLLAGGILIGSTTWGINQQIASRRSPSSVFAKTLTTKSLSRPIVRTASGSILLSTPVAAAAWSPFAMPILIPMFRATNSAGVAFLRPISCHNPVSRSTVTRLLALAPSPQTVMVVSFLTFVGYKNYIHYQDHPFTDDE
jgi:hypothetical protein